MDTGGVQQFGNDNGMKYFDIVAISLQSLFFTIFLAPSMYILVKKWKHLDYFSKWMIIIYQLDMTTKLAFFILEYFLDDSPISDGDSFATAARSLMRSALFLINSMFLMSLHMFVQKL